MELTDELLSGDGVPARWTSVLCCPTAIVVYLTAGPEAISRRAIRLPAPRHGFRQNRFSEPVNSISSRVAFETRPLSAVATFCIATGRYGVGGHSGGPDRPNNQTLVNGRTGARRGRLSTSDLLPPSEYNALQEFLRSSQPLSTFSRSILAFPAL